MNAAIVHKNVWAIKKKNIFPTSKASLNFEVYGQHDKITSEAGKKALLL